MHAAVTGEHLLPFEGFGMCEWQDNKQLCSCRQLVVCWPADELAGPLSSFRVHCKPVRPKIASQEFL